MTKLGELTNKELLIRIDERQKSLSEKIDSVCKKLTEKVDDNEEYKTLRTKVNTLWDNQNKAIGWVIAGATGGGLVKLAEILVTNVFTRF